MSFKIQINATKFLVLIHQIRINAKFKCQLDIFLKNGSQKEQLYQSLKIQNCKVIFPQTVTKSQAKSLTVSASKAKINKVQKKCLLIFQLRSKSYNAYAGEVQLDFSSQQKTKHQCSIQNCVDDKAIIVYQIQKQDQLNKSKFYQPNSKSMSKISQQKSMKDNKKSLDKSLVQQEQKQLKSSQSSILKKKSLTSVQNGKYRLNFKNQQKSSFSNYKSLSPKYGSSILNNSTASVNKSYQFVESNTIKQQQHSQQGQQKSSLKQINLIKQIKLIKQVKQIKTPKSRNDQKYLFQQNSIQINKSKLLKSKSSTPQITKKIIQLQKKLDQEKQKSLRFQLQLQSRKNQIKQLTKQLKTHEKKSNNFQNQLKKSKKTQTHHTKQNQQLKDLVEILKQKLGEKTQHFNVIVKRHNSKEQSFKDQLKNVYVKLENIHKEKQFKNHENLHLGQQMQKIQKKTIMKIQEKDQLLGLEKQRNQKMIKNLEKQLACLKEYFVKSTKQFGKEIQQMLKHQADKGSKTVNVLVQSSSFQSSTTSYSLQVSHQAQLNKQYSVIFRELCIKIQRISNQLHDNILQKQQVIQHNQKQIHQLKSQLRSMHLNLQNFQDLSTKQKQKYKKQIELMQLTLMQQRTLNDKKIKVLRIEKKQLQDQIQLLNNAILNKNRQISSLKILKQQLQISVTKLNQQMKQKIQEHRQKVKEMTKQNQQLSIQYKQQVATLQGKLSKQQLQNKQLQKRLLELSKTIQNNQKQLHQLQLNKIQMQKQLKSSLETNNLVVKQMSQLKNMITEITGFKAKNQKQFSQQNKELASQVTNFKQSYKTLQQTKNQIQQQLQKMQAQIRRNRQEKEKAQEDMKKIQKIFNTTQKSSTSLRNMILDMKKQNQQLNIKLRKKQQFQHELQDQFQCSFYQIREKLQYFINHNKDIQKQKTATDRQYQLKTKKYSSLIDSLTNQLNKIQSFQSESNIQLGKLFDVGQQLKKIFANLQKQKEGGFSSYVSNQFKDKIVVIDKVYEEIMTNYGNLNKVLQQSRKTRQKSTASLRRGSTTDNQSIMRKSSTMANSNVLTGVKQHQSPKNATLTKRRSMVTSLDVLNKKKDAIKVQRIGSNQEQKLEQGLEDRTTNKSQTHPQMILSINEEEKSRQIDTTLKASKRLSKPKLKINTNMELIQQKPQVYTPLEHPKKKSIRRMNTLR